MNCEKAYSLIQDFIDGALGATAAGEFEDHVAGCSKCAAELDAFESLDTLLSRVEFEEVPVGFADAVIGRLKSIGRIREPVPAAGPARRGWLGLFDWVPARLSAPVAAMTLLVILFSVISLTSGRFKEFIGKNTVFATNAYLDVNQTLSSVGFLGRIVDGVGKDIGTVKTIVGAGCSLLLTAGETFMLPALFLVLTLTIGLGWFVKSARKRSNQNASYSF